MDLAVIGTGYVGLVTGACFAEGGNRVICVDKDAGKIEMLQEGKSPIYEPGLEEILADCIESGRLAFTTDLAEAVRHSAIVFLAVDTPPKPDGSVELSSIESAARQIGESLEGYRIIAIKSTVPPGTNSRVREIIAGCTKHAFEVVSNPEFLREGAAVEDVHRPSRVVVGTDSDSVANTFRELYEPFTRNEAPFLVTDPISAELIKYACNSFLGVRISYINEIANLCESLGADIHAVRRGMGFDPRIGFQFLQPGIGYGGMCLPKDLQAIAHRARELETPLNLVDSAHAANERQKRRLAEKLLKYYDGKIDNKIFAIWGVTFKARTSDVRLSPALAVIEDLLRHDVTVRLSDPQGLQNARGIFGEKLEYFEEHYKAAKHAHALLVLTDWRQYQYPDFQRLAKLMARPVIFDGRNLYNPRIVRSHGFHYFGIGVAGP
jgi:UDPglucose 6-dehydrogenase